MKIPELSPEPESILSAVLRANKGGQCTANQYRFLYREMARRGKALIFGLGNDSALWLDASGGDAVFLEDSEGWVSAAPKRVDARTVNYTCSLAEWRKDVAAGAEAVAPEWVRDLLGTTWGVVFVDGPQGNRRNDPSLHGRVQSIAAASLLDCGCLAVHDFDREAERRIFLEFVGEPDLVVDGSLAVKYSRPMGLVGEVPVACVCSPSHGKLLGVMARSLMENGGAGFVLRAGTLPQKCPAAVYGSEGWRETVSEKFGVWRRALRSSSSGIALMCDADVVFLRDFSGDAREFAESGEDFRFQVGSSEGGVCTGFFFARNSARVHDTLAAAEAALAGREDRVGDQWAMNAVLGECGASYSVFSPCFVFHWGLHGFVFGEPGREFISKPGELEIPGDAKVFHANFCVGTRMKRALMERALSGKAFRSPSANHAGSGPWPGAQPRGENDREGG